MTEEQIWNCEHDVATVLGVTVPDWVAGDISPADVAAIVQGGCASGAYMPAVTYWQALETMTRHGDDVLQYIDDTMGEVPAPKPGEIWGGIAVHYLSTAVELWAHDIMGQLEDTPPQLESEDA